MGHKQRVRRQVLERRQARSFEEIRSAGASIARRVLALCDELPAGARVASYLSMGEEPSTGVLVDILRTRGVEVLAPVVLSAGRLDWAAYEGTDATTLNRFGIAEPTGTRLGVEAIGTAGLVVVPGLAVDGHGRRLGRGGGFYDRTLMRTAAGAPRVVPLYDDEVLDAVPYEPHDQCVDIAVTPTRTLRLR